MAKVFTLLVKDSGVPSVDILKYIDDNIIAINEMGVHITISVIESSELTTEMANRLAAQGILRLPSLVTDDNKIRLGVKKIEELFENNKKMYRKYMTAEHGPKNNIVKKQQQSPEFGSNDDFGLAELYKNEMSMDAIKNEQSRKLTNEGFEEGGSGDDYNRRVADQMRTRKITAPRVSGPDRHEEMDLGERTSRSQSARPKPDTNNIKTPTPTHVSKNLPPLIKKGAVIDDSIFDQMYMQGVDV